MRRKHLFLPLFLLSFLFLFQNCSTDSAQQSSDNSTTATENSNSKTDASTDELTAKGMTPAQATLASLKRERPFKELDVPFHKFPKITNQAKTINLPTGTSIEIPENAFVDKDGKPIKGEVEIQYREIFSAAEIITSGLPMHVVDEDGNVEWMQTAGMVEIKGYQKGEEVFIAPGKELTINMATDVDGEYEFWILDTETNNWVEDGTSSPIANPNATESSTTSNTASNNNKPAKIKKPKAPQRPSAPVAFQPEKASFDVDIDFSQFPELKKVEGIIWQYSGTDPAQDPQNLEWVQNEEWLDMNLEESKKANEYILTFISEKNKYSIPVCASQKGPAYEKAMAEYNQKLVGYENSLKEYEGQLKEYNVKLKAYRESNLTARQKFQNKQRKLLRSFRVSNFGVYNCDIIYKMKEAVQVYADFDFGNIPDELKTAMTVFLVTGDNRTVINYPYGSWRNLRFNEKDNNCFIAILPNNTIATFSNKQFKDNIQAIKRSKDKPFKFSMKIESTPIESVADLQNKFISS